MGSGCCCPFSERWLRLDLTSVVDVWIWAVLLLGILGPFLGKLVRSEISSGSVRVRSYGRGWAWFALVFLLLYNYGRSVTHGAGGGRAGVEAVSVGRTAEGGRDAGRGESAALAGSGGDGRISSR